MKVRLVWLDGLFDSAVFYFPLLLAIQVRYVTSLDSPGLTHFRFRAI